MRNVWVKIGVIAVALTATLLMVFAAMAGDIEVDDVVTEAGYEVVTVTFTKAVTVSETGPEGSRTPLPPRDVVKIVDADGNPVTVGSEPDLIEIEVEGLEGEGTTWELELSHPVDPNVTFLRFVGFEDGDGVLALSDEPVPMTEADLLALVDGLGRLPLDLAELEIVPFAGPWLADLSIVGVSTPRWLDDLLAEPLPTRADLTGEEPVTQRSLAVEVEAENPGLTLAFGNRTLTLAFAETHDGGITDAEPLLVIEELDLLIDDEDPGLKIGLRDDLVVALENQTWVLDTNATSLAVAVEVAKQGVLSGRLGFVDATATNVDIDLAIKVDLGLTCSGAAASCAPGSVGTSPSFSVTDPLLMIGAFDVTDSTGTTNYSVTEVVAGDDDEPLQVAWSASADGTTLEIAVEQRKGFDDALVGRFATVGTNAVTLGLEGLVQWFGALRDTSQFDRPMPLVDGSPLDVVDLAALLGDELADLVGTIVEAGGDLSAQRTAALLCEEGWLNLDPTTTACDGVAPGLVIHDVTGAPQRLTLPIDLSVSHTFPAAPAGDEAPWAARPLALDLDLALAEAIPGLTGAVPGFEVRESFLRWDGSTAQVDVRFDLSVDLRFDTELESAFGLTQADLPDTATPYMATLATGQLCQGFVGAVNAAGGSISVLALQQANGWLGDADADGKCDRRLRELNPSTPLVLPLDAAPVTAVTDALLCAAAANVWQVDVAGFQALNGATDALCATAVRAGGELQFLAEMPSPVQLGHRVAIEQITDDLLEVTLDLETISTGGIGGDVRLGLLDLAPGGTIELDPELTVKLAASSDFTPLRDAGRIDLLELAVLADTDELDDVLQEPALAGTFHGTVDLANSVVVAAEPDTFSMGVDASGEFAEIADSTKVTLSETTRITTAVTSDVEVAIVLGDWAGLEDLDAESALAALTGGIRAVAGALSSAPTAVELPFTGVSLQDMAAAPGALDDLADGLEDRIPTRLTTLDAALRAAVAEAGLGNALTVSATGTDVRFRLNLSRDVSRSYPFSLDLADLVDLPVPINPLDGGATINATASFVWQPTLAIAFAGTDPLQRLSITGDPSVNANFSGDVRGDAYLGPLGINLDGAITADPSLTLRLSSFVGTGSVTAASLRAAVSSPTLPTASQVLTVDGGFGATLNVGPVPSGSIALSGTFAQLIASPGNTPPFAVTTNTIDFTKVSLDLGSLARGAIQTARFVGDTLRHSDTLSDGLPLLGTVLTDASTVGADLRTAADQLAAEWDAADEEGETFVTGLEGRLEAEVCSPLGLIDCVTVTLLTEVGGSTVTTSFSQAKDIRIAFALGETLDQDHSLRGGLDFGDVIDLSLDTDVQYKLGYRASVVFGVNLTDGFYVDTAGGNLVELFASMSVTGLDAPLRVAGVEIASLSNGTITLAGGLGGTDAAGAAVNGAGFALQLNGGEPLTLRDLADRTTPRDRLLTPIVDIGGQNAAGDSVGGLSATLPVSFAGGLDYVPTVSVPIYYSWAPSAPYVVTQAFDPVPDMTLTIGTAADPITVDASAIVEDLIAPILSAIGDNNPVDLGPVRGGLDYEIQLIEQSVREIIQVGATGSPGLQFLLAMLDLAIIADDLENQNLTGVVPLGHVILLPSYDASNVALDLSDSGLNDLLDVIQQLQNIFPTTPSRGTSSSSSVSSSSTPTGTVATTTSASRSLPSGLVRFPALEQPLGLVTLVTGGVPAEPVSFIEIDPGPLRIVKGGSLERQLFDIDAGFISGSLTVRTTGQVGLELNLGFGYDSRGITSGNLFYGLYLVEPVDERGRPKEVVALFAELGAGVNGRFGISVAGIDVSSARFRGSGNARLSVGLNLYVDSPAIPEVRRTNGRLHFDDIGLIQQGHYLPNVAGLFGSGDFATAANTLCVFRPGVRFTADLGFDAEAYVLGARVWKDSWDSNWPGFSAGVSCPSVHQVGKVDDGVLTLNAGPDHWQDRLDGVQNRPERFLIAGAGGKVRVTWTGNASNPVAAQFKPLVVDPDEVREILVDLGGRNGGTAGEIVIAASATDVLGDVPITILGSTGADTITVDADVTARIVTNGGDSTVTLSAGTNSVVATGGDTVILKGGDNQVRSSGGSVAFEFVDDWGQADLFHQGGDAELDFSDATGPIVGDSFYGTGEIRSGTNLAEFNVDGFRRLETTTADGDDVTLRGDVPDGFTVTAGGGDDNRIEVDVSRVNREIFVVGNPDATETLVITGTRAADTFLFRAQPPGDEDVHNETPDPCPRRADPDAADPDGNCAAPAEDGFVALFDPAGGVDTPVERVTYDNDVAALEVDGVAGANEFYLDDVATVTTIRGGDGAGDLGNLFQVGQLFEETREFDIGTANLARAEDEVRSRAVFDQGPMTLGVSHETTIFGGDGNDEFSVYSNVARLNLRGISGNNSFILRAFIADGTVQALGGDGNDVFSYVENAPVDIVGGGGFNTMFVFGTQGSDGVLIDDDLDPNDFDLSEVVDAAGNPIELEDVDLGGIAICSVLIRGDDGFPVDVPVDRVPGEPGQEDVTCGVDATFRQIQRVVTASIGGRNAIWVRGTSPERATEAYGGPDGATVLVGDEDGLLDGIQGPVTVAGDLGDALGVDFQIETRDPVALPGEDATKAPDPRRICYAFAPNQLVVWGAGHTDALDGTLTEDRLSGLGMWPGGTIPTEDPAQTRTVPAGIIYGEFDELTILLGDGADSLVVEDTGTFTRPGYVDRLPPGTRSEGQCILVGIDQDGNVVTDDDGTPTITEYDLEPRTPASNDDPEVFRFRFDFRAALDAPTNVETDTTIVTNDGDDTVVVGAIAGRTTVLATGDEDVVIVGSAIPGNSIDGTTAFTTPALPDGESTLDTIVDLLRVVGPTGPTAGKVDVRLDASGTDIDEVDGLGDVVEFADGVVRGLSMPGEVRFENVRLLEVFLTDGEDVVNVTDTTAATTRIHGLDGDDRFFVSDDADYGLDTGHALRTRGSPPHPRADNPDVATPAYLAGTLGGIVKYLEVEAGDGDNLLMISDLDGVGPTGTEDAPAVLRDDALTGAAVGDIRFDTSATGTFAGGITVWTSDGSGDHVDVTGARLDGDPTTLAWSTDRVQGAARTITTLNAGGGDDDVTVSIDEGDGLLVVNLGDGDDTLDGSASTLGFIVFGGAGDDTVTTGSGDDIVFGDHGTVRYLDAGGVVTSLGDDRLANVNDGRARRPEEIRTVWGADLTVRVGANTIQVGDGDDVAFGGVGNDRIEATSGRNALIGDHGQVWRDDSPQEVAVRTNDGFLDDVVRNRDFAYDVDVFDDEGGGNDVILGGSDGDVIFGGPGNDVIVGTPGEGEDATVESLEDAEVARADGDIIFAGDGDDIVWGGPGDDRIYGGNGRNIIDIKQPTFDANLTERVHDEAWWDAAWLLAPDVDAKPQPGQHNGFDLIYGGRGQDVIQVDAGGPGQQVSDRAINWYGQYNLFLTCDGAFGAGQILRQPSPGMPEALIELAEADGAYQASDTASSGWRQLALVTREYAGENRGRPHPDSPGNNATCF